MCISRRFFSAFVLLVFCSLVGCSRQAKPPAHAPSLSQVQAELGEADCEPLGKRLDAVGFALDKSQTGVELGQAEKCAAANANWESARQNMKAAQRLLASCPTGRYSRDYGYYVIEEHYAHEGHIRNHLSDRDAYVMFVRDLDHLLGVDGIDADIDLAHNKQEHPGW